ncbi:Flavin carrier protein 2, partial [Neolecta irregularis DAH-3]
LHFCTVPAEYPDAPCACTALPTLLSSIPFCSTLLFSGPLSSSILPSTSMSRPWPSPFLRSLVLVLVLLFFASTAAAERLIGTTSLATCMANSAFSASTFQIIYTPDNSTIQFDIDGVISIGGNVTAKLVVIAYGKEVVTQLLNPCKLKVNALCPASVGHINMQETATVPADYAARIPGIVYNIPDIDGIIKIYIFDAQNNTVACVQASLTNGKTVYSKAVGWVSAAIAGTALLASAITSGLGHSYTAAHVAANTMSLFSWFQSQAIFGMSSVHLPPVYGSWCQNFQWTLGIIKITFLQNIATWYVKSTGGTPDSLLTNVKYGTASVTILKRSLGGLNHIAKRDASSLSVKSTVTTVRGIERVAYRAGIELSNVFMTGLMMFVIFILLVVVGMLAFKVLTEWFVKMNLIKSDRFLEYRQGWKTIMKGTMYRLILISYVQQCVLCLWEFTQKDSPAVMILAILILLNMTFLLCWAAAKVLRLARKSVTIHNNPAYILYSDPQQLNRWGFLYIQFRAPAYYFIVFALLYLFMKGVFTGLLQSAPTAQAIALVIVELGLFGLVLSIRPFMDKRTNYFNIAISSVNLLNGVFLLIFSNIFDLAGIVAGILGVVAFIMNAVFALVLLIMVGVSAIFALTSKNPDVRYQPMRDDRASFIRGKAGAPGQTELDALALKFRGEGKDGSLQRKEIEDSDTADESIVRHNPAAIPLPPSTSSSVDSRHMGYREYNNAYSRDQYNGSQYLPVEPQHRSFGNQGNATPDSYHQGYSSPIMDGHPELYSQPPLSHSNVSLRNQRSQQQLRGYPQQGQLDHQQYPPHDRYNGGSAF